MNTAKLAESDADMKIEIPQEYMHGMQKEMRNGFIRKGKVFSLLGMQLLLTVIIASFFRMKSIAPFLVENPSLMIVSMVGSFVFLFSLVCCRGVAQKAPGNYILLFCFTVCMGLMMGFNTAYFDDDIVLMAALTTLVIVAGLVVYAFTTKTDLTGCGVYFLMAVIALILMGLLAAIFRTNFLYIALSAAGAFIFSCYLVYDLQQLMIGERENTVSPDEYVYATISLYLDIINIFLYILRLLGAARNE